MTETTARLTRGAGWIYGYRWLDRLLGFLAVVGVARLLSPEAYGLFAIAASYVVIIEGLGEFDVNSALIRTRDEHRDLYDCAWTLSVMRGVVSCLLMLAVSAAFVDDRRIVVALYVLALGPLLTGFSNPRFIMFERQLNYAPLAMLTIAARVVAIVVTVAVAFVYRSYWALVFGQVSGAVMTLVLTYVLRPYQPRFSLQRSREILSFSGWMSLTTMVTTLSMQSDRIIVGRLLGVSDAGSYHMTQNVGVAPTAELVGPLRRVLFPSFSAIAHDLPRLRRAVCESIGVLGSLSLAAGVGFAFAASDFVPLVLGSQWISIVPLLQLLVPFLGLRATLSMTQACVMALGRTKLLFTVSVIYACVHLPLFIWGTAKVGLFGAIGAIVAASFFYSYLNAAMLKATLGIGLLEVLASLRRPLVSISVMSAVLLLAGMAGLVALDVARASVPSLLTKVSLGAAAFGVTHYALWRREGRPGGIEQRLLQMLRR